MSTYWDNIYITGIELSLTKVAENSLNTSIRELPFSQRWQNNLIHTSTIRELSCRQSLQKNLLHTSIRELPFRYTLQRLHSILQPDKVGKQASLYFNRELHVMKEHTASVKVDKTFRSE